MNFVDWRYYYPETLKEWFNYPFIWAGSTVGGAFGGVNLIISMHPIFYLWGYLSNFFDYTVTERLLYLYPSVFLPGLSSFYLVRHITKNNVAALIGSFVFSFNTYLLYSRATHFPIVMSASLGLFVIYFFIKSLEEQRTRFAVWSGLIGLLASYYEFRFFYIIAWLLIFYFIYYLLVINDSNKLKNSLRLFRLASTPFVIVFLGNFYWLLGLQKAGSFTTNALFNRGVWGNQFSNIFQAFTLWHPFWSNSRLNYPTYFSIHAIPIYFWLIPIIAFTGLILNVRHKNIVFFGAIALLGIFLNKQSGAPISGAYSWLYYHFPGFNAFREASKFFYVIALSYSILIAGFIAYIWQNFRQNRLQKNLVATAVIGVSLLFLWNAKPFVTRSAKTVFVARHIPTDYSVLNNYILRQPGFFRSIWVPRTFQFGVYNADKRIVSLADLFYTDWYGFAIKGGHRNLYDLYPDEINKAVDRWQRAGRWRSVYMVALLERSYAANLFSASSVKYLIVPIRDRANDDDYFIYYGNNRQLYIETLDSLPFLKRVNIKGTDVKVYENKAYKPHVYATETIEDIFKKIKYRRVDFKYINPTEYRINLKNISKKTYINFSETFNPGWKVKVSDFSRFGALRNNKYFLPDTFHKKNNAGFNSFIVDPNYIKKKYDSSAYTVNSDGSLNLHLTLYFFPQSYVYFGLIISGLTLFGCVGYLGYDWRRSRNKKLLPDLQ